MGFNEGLLFSLTTTSCHIRTEGHSQSFQILRHHRTYDPATPYKKTKTARTSRSTSRSGYKGVAFREKHAHVEVMGNEERNFMQMYFHDFRDCERVLC